VQSSKVATSAQLIIEFNIKAMYKSSEKIPHKKIVTKKENDEKTK
jgi:hypothetical protein